MIAREEPSGEARRTHAPARIRSSGIRRIRLLRTDPAANRRCCRFYRGRARTWRLTHSIWTAVAVRCCVIIKMECLRFCTFRCSGSSSVDPCKAAAQRDYQQRARRSAELKAGSDFYRTCFDRIRINPIPSRFKHRHHNPRADPGSVGGMIDSKRFYGKLRLQGCCRKMASDAST